MTCFPCESQAKNNKVDLLIVEPGQTIIRQPQKNNVITTQQAVVPFKLLANKNVEVDNSGISLQSLDNAAPFGFNGDLITNGDFLLTPTFTGWDTPHAYYSGIPSVGAILDPDPSYSIKQDVTGDPTRFYKVSFQAATELPLSVSDGYVRIEIVDTLTNVVILDETTFVNNLIGVRHYNVRGIGQAEVRFYAIGHSISLLKVSITDGPLMATDRADIIDLYDFVHSNEGFETVPTTPLELSGLHQIPEVADGLYLSPHNSDVKMPSVLSVNSNSQIDIHQPFVDGVIDQIPFAGHISDIDFGYENGLLKFYTCSELTSINLKKFGIDGSVASVPISSPFRVKSLKKELHGDRLWVASADIPYIYEIDFNNSVFPSIFGYALDIDVRAMAHDPVADYLYCVGQDLSFLPAIRSSVYKTELSNFGITTKIFTVDGLYKSVECISSVPDLLGSFQPLSGRIIIGGDRSVPFGPGPDDQILIAIDPSGVVDWAYDIPEVQKISDISAIQIEDGRRPGIKCLLTDPVNKAVFTIDVRSGYGFKHYYNNEATASLQAYIRKPSRKIEKDIFVNQNKWYIIDTDIVDNEWTETGPLGGWYNPLSVYTTDGVIRNADIGQNGPSVFNPALNTDFYKKSNNLYGRILYRPTGPIMRIGFDAREESLDLIERASDGARLAKLSGLSVSEISFDKITLVDPGQIKETFTFDTGPQTWTLNGESSYNAPVRSIDLTAAVTPTQVNGYIEKTFNVRKFKKFKLAININRNNTDLPFTGIVIVKINGVTLFENDVGEYLIIPNKTGYFEAEMVPQVDNITVRIECTSYSVSINYICAAYSEPSDLFDPCAFQDVKTSISFQGVPLMPYNIYGMAIRYTLRDYQDPSIRGTVTVPQKPFNLSIVGGQPFKCYGWFQFPENTQFTVDNVLLNTAIPGTIVDTSANTNLIWAFRNDFSTTPGLPPVNVSFPLYYENIPNRVVSGNPICTQHEDSPFFKPCVVESIEFMMLMASAPNLLKSYSLFGSGCGPKQVMDINLNYIKDGELVRTSFNTTFDLIYSMQVVGSGSQPPNYLDLGQAWDVGVHARMMQARWESFKVILDLPSGAGVDQCTLPIDGFTVQGSGEFNAGNLIANQTGGGGGGGGGNQCTVQVIVDTISDGSSSPANVHITLHTPDNGTWRIVYGDLTSGDVTPSLPWNASPAQVKLALSGLSSLNSNLVDVTGQFPTYILTFNASLGVIPEITVINNLTCVSPPLGYVNPGPYNYELPKPGPNTGVVVDNDNCNLCLPSMINTIKIHRESISVGCFTGECSNSIRTIACRFVNNANRFGLYKYVNGTLVQLDNNYDPVPGDQIVLLDNSIGSSGVPLDRIGRSFSYV